MCSDFSEQRITVFVLAILICAGSSLAQSSATKDLEKPSIAADKDLIGLWSGEGEMIEFRADGVCRYAGELYSYKLSQGHLIIELPGGNVVFTYQLKDAQLLLTANGQQSVYSRVPLQPATKNSVTANRNPPDLVGRWCYLKTSTGSFSGRCITLNADGTYRYKPDNSLSHQTNEFAGGISALEVDSGKWFVEKDRLYYQSAIRGYGWYRLERRNHPVNVNDPMIVLDNEPFVTTTQRVPWR